MKRLARSTLFLKMLFGGCVVSALASVLVVPQLSAFPSNTRLGYSSCQSCHVSPTGGGVLKPYGRASASDFLSTWSYETEAQFGHGAFKENMEEEKTFLFGGDIRQVAFRRGDHYRRIEMQKDFEVAVLVGPFTLVTSLGFYAKGLKGQEFAVRRNYLMYTLNENLALRFGKFFLAYGIHHEDHTIATRKGLRWDQGQETLNAELSLKNRLGELFLTANLGKVEHLLKAARPEVKALGIEEGVGLRGAVYLGESSQVGMSYYYGNNKKLAIERQAYGPYAMVGLGKKSYALLEIDRLLIKGAKAQLMSYHLLGVEAIRGLHAQAFYETTDTTQSRGLKLQWFPRPHWEVGVEYEFAKLGNTASALLHYYF